ncbi:1056_t:CDS:2, partial [Ambispora leptoticha]
DIFSVKSLCACTVNGLLYIIWVTKSTRPHSKLEKSRHIDGEPHYGSTKPHSNLGKSGHERCQKTRRLKYNWTQYNLADYHVTPYGAFGMDADQVQ